MIHSIEFVLLKHIENVEKERGPLLEEEDI